MSDNGEYVFFDTQAALVPQATNHTLDTYQWHEDQTTHERSLALVGSGYEPRADVLPWPCPQLSAHTEQAREAGNVFIGTHARLSPVQANEVGNIYDARFCEPLSPCIEPPPGKTAQCQGGECQKPPPAPPDPTATLLAPPFAAPASPPATSKPKPLTNAQKLAAALKACRKDTSRKRRQTCEAQARKKYPVKAAKKSSTARRATTDRGAGR